MNTCFDLKETPEDFCFGNGSLCLSFDGQTGGLRRIEGKGMNAFGTSDCVLLLDGQNGDTLSREDLNVNWSHQTVENAHTEGHDPHFCRKVIVKTQKGTCLQVTSRFGDFELTTGYELCEIASFCRSFEVHYLGKIERKLRGVSILLPAVQGLSYAEWPEKTIPYAHPLAEELLPFLAEDGYHLMPQGSGFERRANAVLLHGDNGGISVSNLNLKEENCQMNVVRFGSGFAIQQVIPVCAWLSPGETVCFGRQKVCLFEGAWQQEVKRIGDEFENLGCRVNAQTDRKLLKGLVIYETEIGFMKFRPEKIHHGYASVQELIDDLPRLQGIGYNCIQLMPSFPFPAYSIYDLHRPEWQHAEGQDLRPLIKAAHRLGLKVILDVLMHGLIDKEIAGYNQKTYQSRKYYYPEWEKLCEWEVHPLRREHPDWFIRQDDGRLFPVYTWSLDWAQKGVQDWFIQALRMYVEDLDADGFRFDAPTWVDAANWNPEVPHRPDRSYIAGVCEAFSRARFAIDPLKKNLIWLTEPEDLPFRPSLDVSYSYSTLPMLAEAFAGKITARQLQAFLAVRKRINPAGALYVNWMDNHDSWTCGTEERGQYVYEWASPAYARAVLALALFQEGAYMAFAHNERFEPEYYQKLIALRQSEAIFTEGECDFEALSANCEDILCMLWTHHGEKLAVAIHMGREEKTVRLKGMPSGSYQNLVTQDEINPNAFSMQPGECCLLKLVNNESEDALL